ncbi:unnamed protein product [Musa acuminata subsp. malaccensis]|uniref:(wild Malaysian banana) hypothetical protein n=1 Tax=Musa acuminata subsp. malaccensis TaxID=214687 RepID=A0A804JAE8_MUSAM|nr:unnamed protein product [Musa acuminata subsp. malaccensis]
MLSPTLNTPGRRPSPPWPSCVRAPKRQGKTLYEYGG